MLLSINKVSSGGKMYFLYRIHLFVLLSFIALLNLSCAKTGSESLIAAPTIPLDVYNNGVAWCGDAQGTTKQRECVTRCADLATKAPPKTMPTIGNV